MAIYAISDLHLSFGTEKPMDIFSGWSRHTEKIKEHWERKIKPCDTVLIPGDISWAMNFDELSNDLRWLDALPGRKIVMRGNHDYWWATMNKLNRYLEENEFQSISFLYNNAYLIENTWVFGSRGWLLPENQQFSAEDRTILEREYGRLALSFEQVKREEGQKLICLFHYPPFCGEKGSHFLDFMAKHQVDECLYGHLHGRSAEDYDNVLKGVHCRLVACDALGFDPILISE